MQDVARQGLLQRLAQAYFQRERQRLGTGAEERAASEAASSDLVRRAQAARTMQQVEMAPAEAESESDLRAAQAEAQRALAGQREVPKPGTPHYTVDEQGVVRAITPQAGGEGFGVTEIGPYGQRPRDIRTPPSGPSEGGFAANPFNVTDSQGNTRLAVRVKGGGIQFVNDIGGEKITPGPTADMRNVEFQAQAVEPAFELVQKSLDTLKTQMEGFGSTVAGVVPGTNTYYAKTRFQDQAKALLGAIVARQAGEGSRLSDEDRRAYSQASTLVNNLILLPGGVEEAQDRLNDAKGLLNQVMQRRRGGGVVAPGAPVGGAETRVINGVPYVKVPGGWQRQK